MAPALTTLHVSRLLQQGHLPGKQQFPQLALDARPRGGNPRQLSGPLPTHCTHIWWKGGFQPIPRKAEKKPIANVNCGSGRYILGGRPATPCDLNRLEERARSKLMKFSTGEEILPHHLVLLKTLLCTASSSGLPSIRKTLTNWRESSSDHQGGDEAAAHSV